MPHDVPDGVIVANVGHCWKGPTDHPPLGALLILTKDQMEN